MWIYLLKRLLRRAGRIAAPALEALEMMLMRRPGTGTLTMMAALSYLLMPADLIPDILPVAGFSDDLVALTVMMGIWNQHITPDIRDRLDADLTVGFLLAAELYVDDHLDPEFEQELTALLKDWLKQQGRTQADLRRSLRAVSTRMPALLEVLEREFRLNGSRVWQLVSAKLKPNGRAKTSRRTNAQRNQPIHLDNWIFFCRKSATTFPAKGHRRQSGGLVVDG